MTTTASSPFPMSIFNCASVPECNDPLINTSKQTFTFFNGDEDNILEYKKVDEIKHDFNIHRMFYTYKALVDEFYILGGELCLIRRRNIPNNEGIFFSPNMSAVSIDSRVTRPNDSIVFGLAKYLIPHCWSFGIKRFKFQIMSISKIENIPESFINMIEPHHTCPLCEYEYTDAFTPANVKFSCSNVGCKYQICRSCFGRLREISEVNCRCPYCREPYTQHEYEKYIKSSVKKKVISSKLNINYDAKKWWRNQAINARLFLSLLRPGYNTTYIPDMYIIDSLYHMVMTHIHDSVHMNDIFSIIEDSIILTGGQTGNDSIISNFMDYFLKDDNIKRMYSVNIYIGSANDTTKTIDYLTDVYGSATTLEVLKFGHYSNNKILLDRYIYINTVICKMSRDEIAERVRIIIDRSIKHSLDNCNREIRDVFV